MGNSSPKPHPSTILPGVASLHLLPWAKSFASHTPSRPGRELGSEIGAKLTELHDNCRNCCIYTIYSTNMRSGHFWPELKRSAHSGAPKSFRCSDPGSGALLHDPIFHTLCPPWDLQSWH